MIGGGVKHNSELQEQLIRTYKFWTFSIDLVFWYGKILMQHISIKLNKLQNWKIKVYKHVTASGHLSQNMANVFAGTHSPVVGQRNGWFLPSLGSQPEEKTFQTNLNRNIPILNSILRYLKYRKLEPQYLSNNSFMQQKFNWYEGTYGNAAHLHDRHKER